MGVLQSIGPFASDEREGDGGLLDRRGAGSRSAPRYEPAVNR
jgi:hypothetical protein